MKDFFRNSAFKTIALVTIFAIIFIVITYNWFINFSSFSIGMAKSVLGIFLVWVFDRFAVKEIDTIEELKKGNIAYALFVLGIFIVIAAAIVYS